MSGDKTKSQRILRAAAGLTAFALVSAVFIFLKEYPFQKPVTVGPLKQAFLWMFTALLAAELYLIFCGIGKRQRLAVGCFLAGVIFFCGKLVLEWTLPESSLLSFFSRLFPLGMFFLIGGISLTLPDPPVGKRTDQGTFLLALGILFIMLSPVFHTGYAWDDCFFTSEIPAMRMRGESIWSRMFGEIIEYGKMGRLNPFATFHFLVFYLSPNPFVYKCFLVLLTLCSAALFYRFLHQLFGNSVLARISLLILPLCFQLRLYNDPLTGYYGLMQVMFCELMLSLSFFLAYLRNNRMRELFFSLLFFLFMLTSYEMAFPLTALFILLAWYERETIGEGIKRSVCHIFLALALFFASMLLRRLNITAETAYSGTTFALDPAAIFLTLWNQVTGAFPLSYQFAGNDAFLLGHLFPAVELFPTSLFQFVKNIRLEDTLALFGAWLFICGFIKIDETKAKRENQHKLLFFTLGLLVLPGLVISLSEKYQRDLVFGLSYIPVFFSCFGAALLFACLICWIPGNGSPIFQRMCLGVFALVFLMNQQNNRRVAEHVNEIFLYPRTVGEEALQAGLLGDNEDLQQVISARSYSLWEMGWQKEPYQTAFYTANSGKLIHALSAEDYIRSLSEGKKGGLFYPPATRLVDYDGDRNKGYAKSARVRETRIDFDGMKLKDTLVTDVLIYLKGFGELDPLITYQTREGDEHQVRLSEAWHINQTADGKLVKIQENEVIRFDSIGVMLYR